MAIVTRRENSQRSDTPSEGLGVFVITRRHLVVGAIWTALIALALIGPTGEVAFGLAAAGTIGAIVFGVHRYRPARRAPWWMALGAFTLFIIGGVARDDLHTLGVLTVHRSLIPDLIVLPGYALLGAALIGIIRARTGSMVHRLGIIYDGVIASLAVLALSLVYVIEPVLARRSAPVDVKLILSSYPAVSLFLLIITLQIAFGTSHERCTADRFLIAALASMFIGDAFYMLAEIHLLNISSNLLDLPYVIAFAGAASCALDPSMRTLTEPASKPAPRWTPGRIGLVAVAFVVPAILILQQRHYALERTARAVRDDPRPHHDGSPADPPGAAIRRELRSTPHLPSAARRPHRAAEPPTDGAAPRSAGAVGVAEPGLGRVALDRPRPVQAHQRHDRAQSRRRAPDPGRQAPHGKHPCRRSREPDRWRRVRRGPRRQRRRLRGPRLREPVARQPARAFLHRRLGVRRHGEHRDHLRPPGGRVRRRGAHPRRRNRRPPG